MKCALIGTGMVADMHVRAATDAKGVELIGVYTRNPEKCASFAQANGLRAFASLEEIAASDIDFALIATPPNARFNVLEPLITKGKHILLEKPVARNSSEAKELVAVCRDAKVSLGVMLQHRMRPAALDLKTRLDLGALGPITSVEISVPWWRDQAYYDAPGRGTQEQDGGGVLITQAIHTLDLALHLAGPARCVSAMARTSPVHDMECENFVTAGLEFEGGALGTLFATTTSFPGGPESITLHCAQATAMLSGNALKIHWRDGRQESFGAAGKTGGGADPMAFTHEWHQAVIEDFAQSLEQQRPPLISGLDALPVHALIDAILAKSKAEPPHA